MKKYLQDVVLNLGVVTTIISRLANLIPGERAKEVEKALDRYTDVMNAIYDNIAEINKSITEDENNEEKN